ncbi:unannotated protein [freshwater metagenome]|uniref:Unannotated protein n=1 Tax=freshwater metagenome TaxID=449393 RepID=A0A6J7VEP1_9ZZZZ
MPHLCAVVFTAFVEMMIPVEVVGVRIEMPSNQPIVLLKEVDGSRFLPIWVGAVEATSIAFAQQGVEPPRPLTHDLISLIISSLDTTVTAVHLTHLQEGVFYANLVLTDAQSNEKIISARPSDAIAIALRTDAAIFASRQLLDEAGIEIPSGEGDDPSSQSNEEVERFREFLDQINPEDFIG